MVGLWGACEVWAGRLLGGLGQSKAAGCGGLRRRMQVHALCTCAVDAGKAAEEAGAACAGTHAMHECH